MVNYERPELVEVSDFVETVNLASGEGGPDVQMWWTHHNSGTLSTLKTITNFTIGCNSASLHIYMADPNVRFAKILSCSRGNAEIKDEGKRIKVTFSNDWLNGNVNCNLELQFTPGPYVGEELGSYKVPLQYDTHIHTPRENWPVMPCQDEVCKPSEVYAFCKLG